jgi:hypothetical protein
MTTKKKSYLIILSEITALSFAGVLSFDFRSKLGSIIDISLNASLMYSRTLAGSEAMMKRLSD